MPSTYTYADVLRANAYIQKAADSFFFQCTTRTVQESKLFPVNPYIALSYLQAWYRWPEILRKVDAAMPAEEIGDRARQVGSYVNTITMGLIPNFYMGGRQILMDLGMLKPTDALDDVMSVLDFGQRINLAYHRSHGHIVPSDAALRDQVHTARQTAAFEDAAIGVTPGDRLHTSFNHFMAALSAYGFLSHCECRLSFSNHGPYRTRGGHEMLVRDAMDLAECDYPWMDGVAGNIEHNNLTVPVIMKDTHFNIVDDWGSFEATPSYDSSNLVAVGLYTSDFLSEGYIPVHMDNASDLADYLDHLREELEEATAGMWKMMAGWTRDQMIDAGLLVYAGVLKDMAHFAGVYEQDDWFKVEERAQRLKPLMNDEYGGSLIAEIVGFVSLATQNRSEFHMAKYSDARGEMWTPIPYSVLVDDEWTSGVGPIRSGSTGLPEKTARYTTTRGKLTQEECNQLAREFHSGAHALRHYDDDTWVKFHPDDPKAAELEAAARGSSATMAAGCGRVSGASLAGLLDGPAGWSARRPAVLVGDAPFRTWEGLADAVARRAGALRDRHGIAPGDAVALFADNHPAYIEALFAIWHAGAVAVPISSRLHAREAADIVARGHAGLCFATASVAEDLVREAGDATVIVLGEADDDALLRAEPMAPVTRAPTDDAWIFFTSGTTGSPKGARLTHHNLFALAAAYYADVAEVAPHDAIVHVAALSHASGLLSLPFVARGAAQVLPPSGGFDAAELLGLVGAGERSSFFVPPTLLRRLSAAQGAASVDPERLGTIVVGAAPVLPSDLRDGVAAFGPCLWNGYGQGESPCTITAHGKAAIGAAVHDGDEAALRSVGVARAGMRVRVVDAGDREVAPGEVGEVVVDGPTVMAGYLDLPEATAQALRGGWLHTGDVGAFDGAGRLTLLDRAKEVIISGGYNVYPREVEDVLIVDPAVAETAVVGLPDPDWGERVVAFVVPAPGAAIDEAALDRRCLQAIARHKRPKQYHVVDELPRNAAGKVLKRELRESAKVADGAR